MRARPALSFTVAALVVVLLFVAGPAWSDDGHDDSTTTTTMQAGAVSIGDGFSFTEAVITAPDGSAPRTLDAYHTATFVQSWLAQGVFGGSDVKRDPPAEAPVYRVDVTGDWGDTTGTVTVYYAVDGTTPFIAWPENQPPATGPVTPPPASNWFVAPDRTVDAFNGTAELIETGAMVAATTTTAGSADPAGSGSGGGSSSRTLLAGGGLVAGALLLGLGIRRRRTSAAA